MKAANATWREIREALPFFECTRCGACCEGSGTVRITMDEAEEMAAVLGLDVYEFTQRYTRLTHSRSKLELTEREDGACVFLDETGRCKVQAAKPRQCRDFPHNWIYPGFEKICPGMQIALKRSKKTKLE